MNQIADAIRREEVFSGDGKFERHCHGKIQFPDHVTARKEAKKMHKKFKKRFDAYACQFCHCWHIGSQRTQHAAIKRSERKTHESD